MPTKLLLMYSTHQASAEHVYAIEQVLGEGNVLIAESEEDAIHKVPEVDIIWGHRYLRQVLPYADSLRWVQSTAGGVDRLPLVVLAQKKVILTRATVSSDTIARHAHTMMWTLMRGLHISYVNQLKRDYVKTIPILPQPRKALVIGTGAIGCALAEILKRDGLKVFGVNQSGRVPSCFDGVFIERDWHQLLPEVDAIFLAVPATLPTATIVDKNVMDLLPPHALVINVGRAGSLDHSALCELLRKGRLGGAGLDVTPPELRHENSILWNTPNLLITPHNAAHSYERSDLLEEFFLLQLQRYVNQEPLSSQVSI